MIKLVSESRGSPLEPFVQVTQRLRGLAYDHARYVPRPQDTRVLLAAMRNRSLDMPARLCAARFLLDLDNADAPAFVHAKLFGDNRPAMNNAAYALLAYVGEDPKKAWALDEMMDALKDDRLVVKEGSSREGSDEFSEALDDFCLCLGRTKYKKADAVLRRVLKRQPDTPGAADALAELGDKDAVPLIIRAYPKNNDNADMLLLALGKLKTPEAVDFLISHIEDWLAPEALAMAGSPKALPALQSYQKRLTKPGEKDADHDLELATVRVAIIKLSFANPSAALLSLAENPKEPVETRGHALRAMRDTDSSALTGRIIALSRRDPDPDIKRFCIWLLRDRKSDAITAAMIEHALSTGKMGSQSEDVTAYQLVDALNQRLGTSFDEIQELQAYLRQHAATRPAAPPR